MTSSPSYQFVYIEKKGNDLIENMHEHYRVFVVQYTVEVIHFIVDDSVTTDRSKEFTFRFGRAKANHLAPLALGPLNGNVTLHDDQIDLIRFVMNQHIT